MKKAVLIAALCALLACTAACGRPGVGSLACGPGVSAPAPSPAGAGSLAQPSPPATEPPEETASLDFLSQEQALAYQRAVESTSYMLGGGVNLAHLRGVEPGKEVRVDGVPYCLLSGKYQTYEELRAFVLETFTEACLEQLHFDSSFISYNGQLAANSSGLGSIAELSGVPDTYRLVQATDAAVEFTLIGHYTIWRENESDQEYILRRESSWDETREFPIRLALTEQGWRVDEFHHPAYW